MNSLNLFRPAIKAIAMLMVLGSMIFMTSCKDDADPTLPAPTLTVNPQSIDGLPGAKVTTSVVVDSPAGGKTLTTLVNGSTTNAPAAVTLDGTESQTVAVDFTIPAAAPVGQVYTLIFQATDNNDQLSQVASFVVTVSATPSKPQVQVTADITAATHWTADKIYVLTKLINVGTDTKDGVGKAAPSVKATAVLTIDPGTVILGASGTPGGGLIVHRGSQIIANGTVDKPIIFTSAKPVGGRVAGDWAGLVICGKATNNVKNSGSTGLDGVEELEGAYGGFHGEVAGSTNDADNSGSLKYVRVEYAGYPINPNQEINGITFGSVGSGTTIDYVQVSYSNDDSYEWFGGKVKATHLIAYKGVDDDFDTDNGFSGLVQYGLGIRDANTADQSGSNGFESDNDSGGTVNTPFTDATFANMTIIGGKMAQNTSIAIQFQNVAQIRRNSKIDIVNSFFTGYPNGIFIDNNIVNGLGSPQSATNGDLVLRNNVLAGVTAWGGNGFGSAATDDERTALGLGAVAGANHPVNPRGNLVSAGAGGFSGQVFAITAIAQISAQNALPWFTGTNSNKVFMSWSDTEIGLNGSIFNPNAATPVFLPTAAKYLVTAANVTGAVITGLDDTKYIGAFSTTDWTLTWSNWSPQTTDYTK